MTVPTEIFQPDEMNLLDVDPAWTTAELLKQEGIFFLKDLIEPLRISRPALYKKRKALLAEEQDPWKVMGVRKSFSHWQIRMKVFAAYFLEHLTRIYDELPVAWDANAVVGQKSGIYRLSDVCKLIPFTHAQIRYRSKKVKNARNTMGVWKDEASQQYVADLAIFGPWLKATWKGFSPDSEEVESQ